MMKFLPAKDKWIPMSAAFMVRTLRRWDWVIALGLSLALAVPFVASILGWNTFLYVYAWNTAWTAGESRGIAYLGMDSTDMRPDPSDDMPATLEEMVQLTGVELHVVRFFNWGFAEAFAESRVEPMAPFYFDAFSGGDCTGSRHSLQFPWLLVVLLPWVALLVIRLRYPA